MSPEQPQLNGQPPDRQYYPALDGLRGLAILLVVVYHNFGFINVFFFGWLGVDLFFVLSGFLITDILLKTLGQKGYLRNFYTRRVLRIFPLYFLCLILFLFVFPLLNSRFNIEYYTDNQVWLWTFLQNWLYVFINPGLTNTLTHLWSVGVEEQFYLVWPLIILLIKKPKYLLLFITVLLTGVVGFRLWIWTHHIADLAYFNLYTFTRIDGICIGCMVALLQKISPDFLKKRTTIILLFFAGLNFAFFFLNRKFNFSFPYLALAGYTTFAMMFGLLINEAVTRETKLVNMLLNIPVLKFFGKISFGLYLFHWPLYLLSYSWLKDLIDPFASEAVLKTAVSLLATIAAIAISWVIYRYYETYFLRLKSRFT